MRLKLEHIVTAAEISYFPKITYVLPDAVGFEPQHPAKFG